VTSPATLYQREMHENLGFFATWLPGDPLDIGDVGVLENGRFRKVTSLTELKIPFSVGSSSMTSEVQYSSRQGTNIAASGSAAVTALARGELALEFSSEGAFVFHASGLNAHRLDNLLTIGLQIVGAFKKGKWNESWILVDELRTAARATIVVSQDKAGRMVFSAALDGTLLTSSLADPKLDLKLVSTRGRIVHVVAGKGIRPLYSCRRVCTSLFKGPAFRSAGQFKENELFQRSRINELLSS
jgi:hypothetical protein